MAPTKSYRIWMTPRVGSSVLCKGLEATGIAGKPGEFLTLHGEENFQEKYSVHNYEALREKIWKLCTTENGVFGIKHSWFKIREDYLIKEFYPLKGLPIPKQPNFEELFVDLIPNCRHIFLTRRNKIRQAVSWWKAIKDNVWHLEKGDAHKNEVAFYEENYDFAALSHLWKEAMLRECAIQNYFDNYGIVPLTLAYEDIIQDFPATIQRIIGYLEIDAQDLKIDGFFYEKTATTNSEMWVQRFREEFQAQMDTIW